jgi:amidase
MPFEGPPLARPIKVAFTRNAHGYPIHPEVVENLERAAGILSAAGYQVEEVEPPPVKEAADAWFSVALLEIKLTLDPLAREVGSRTIQGVFDAFYEMSDMVDLEGYFTGVAERTRLVRDWNVFLAEYPLLLTPFLMRPTCDYDYDETYAGVKDLFGAAIYSFGLNYVGFPAGNIPAGFAGGAPCGVQIVGRKFREDLILDALQVIEDEVGVMAHKLWAKENDA